MEMEKRRRVGCRWRRCGDKVWRAELDRVPSLYMSSSIAPQAQETFVKLRSGHHDGLGATFGRTRSAIRLQRCFLTDVTSTEVERRNSTTDSKGIVWVLVIIGLRAWVRLYSSTYNSDLRDSDVGSQRPVTCTVSVRRACTGREGMSDVTLEICVYIIIYCTLSGCPTSTSM